MSKSAPKSESKIQREILIDIGSRSTCRMFRNPAGFDREKKVYYGLSRRDSSDLIGLKSRIIQEEDVGKIVAQFVAIEVKTARGAIRPEQRDFIAMVRKLGGRAGVARSIEEARGIVDGK